ncbi:MFS transporter [Leucobacter luti]|uniref:MFS transporter n=1 Tax=Leucobacter luti TaxID=340320 RepID=UPI003D018701
MVQGSTEVRRAPASHASVPVLAPLLSLFVLGWGTLQFAPLLLFFPRIAPIGDVAIQGIFVVYGASLIPMLLIGGSLSDRFGRPRVVLAAVAVTGLSSGLLMLAGSHPELVLIGRFLTGIGCGIGFSSATAWVTGAVAGARGSRLAMVLTTVGMGTGALVTGSLAWALLALGIPHPAVWAMLPHVALSALAVGVVLQGVRGTHPRGSAIPGRAIPGTIAPSPAPAGAGDARLGLRDPRFLRLVLPLAPWTLICTAVPLATLPSAVRQEGGIDPLLFSAFLTPLPALGGLCVQPLAGRATASPRLLAPLALALAMAGTGIGIAAVTGQSLGLLLVSCFVFGLAHGFCQTTGLRLITAISPAGQLGRNTAVFQALTYVGFFAPFPIALLAQHFPLPDVLLGLLALAALTLVLLLALGRASALSSPSAAASAPASAPTYVPR